MNPENPPANSAFGEGWMSTRKWAALEEINLPIATARVKAWRLLPTGGDETWEVRRALPEANSTIMIRRRPNSKTDSL